MRQQELRVFPGAQLKTKSAIQTHCQRLQAFWSLAERFLQNCVDWFLIIHQMDMTTVSALVETCQTQQSG